MEIEAVVACKAVDKLLKGADFDEVLKYLYFKAMQNDQLMSSYLCYMMFRLASLHLEETDESKLFIQITRMAKEHERRLILG